MFIKVGFFIYLFALFFFTLYNGLNFYRIQAKGWIHPQIIVFLFPFIFNVPDEWCSFWWLSLSSIESILSLLLLRLALWFTFWVKGWKRSGYLVWLEVLPVVNLLLFEWCRIILGRSWPLLTAIWSLPSWERKGGLDIGLFWVCWKRREKMKRSTLVSIVRRSRDRSCQTILLPTLPSWRNWQGKWENLFYGKFLSRFGATVLLKKSWFLLTLRLCLNRKCWPIFAIRLLWWDVLSSFRSNDWRRLGRWPPKRRCSG